MKLMNVLNTEKESSISINMAIYQIPSHYNVTIGNKPLSKSKKARPKVNQNKFMEAYTDKSNVINKRLVNL